MGQNKRSRTDEYFTDEFNLAVADVLNNDREQEKFDELVATGVIVEGGRNKTKTNG